MGAVAEIARVDLSKGPATLSLTAWLERLASAPKAGSRQIIKDGTIYREPVWTIVRSQAPTPAARAHIQQRIDELKRWQNRRQIDETSVQITKLLISFPSQMASSKVAENRAEAYLETLEDLPTWAITEACRRWLRGEAGEHNYNFAPSPPILRKLARSVAGLADGQIMRLERLLSADVVDDPQEFSHEHRLTMLDRLKALFQSNEPKRV